MKKKRLRTKVSAGAGRGKNGGIRPKVLITLVTTFPATIPRAGRETLFPPALYL